MDGVRTTDKRAPHDIAAAALELMRQSDVAPTPENYARWYEQASRLLAEGKLEPPSPDSEADASAIEDAAQRVEQAISGALSVVVQAGEESQGFAQSITRLSQNIPSGADAPALRRVTTDLRTATDGMVQKARLLSKRLDHSRQEIVTLRSELDQARREAETDPLTGVANRKALDRALASEIRDCTAQGSPLSVILIDVDHFKAFNDGHGHLVGDEVLKLLGRLLKASVKGADTVARFGGEEFAVVLPRTGLAGALAVAERIRTDLAARALRSAVTKAAYGVITVSIGAAQLVNGEAAMTLMARADRALYRAKTNGRNQVMGARADGGFVQREAA
jgi:diguanylate cyclase